MNSKFGLSAQLAMLEARVEALERQIRSLSASPDMIPIPSATVYRLPTTDEIKGVVAKVCGVRVSDFSIEKRGKRDITWARQLAMFFCYLYSLGSQEHLAHKHFGGRVHGTLIYAIKRVLDEKSIQGPGQSQYQQCAQKLMSLCGYLPEITPPVSSTKAA